MTRTAAPARRPAPRERLLTAATELFSAHGVHAVGIDRLLREAGVAKASMYATFGSKDALVAAYVRAIDVEDRRRWQAAADGVADPAARILTFFDLAITGQQPDFRGCRYLAVAAVYAHLTTPGAAEVRAAVAEHRRWLVATLTDLLREAGSADSSALGRRLQVIYDGALAGAKLAHDDEPLRTAREMAVALLGG